MIRIIILAFTMLTAGVYESRQVTFSSNQIDLEYLAIPLMLEFEGGLEKSIYIEPMVAITIVSLKADGLKVPSKPFSYRFDDLDTRHINSRSPFIYSLISDKNIEKNADVWVLATTKRPFPDWEAEQYSIPKTSKVIEISYKINFPNKDNSDVYKTIFTISK